MNVTEYCLDIKSNSKPNTNIKNDDQKHQEKTKNNSKKPSYQYTFDTCIDYRSVRLFY